MGCVRKHSSLFDEFQMSFCAGVVYIEKKCKSQKTSHGGPLCIEVRVRDMHAMKIIIVQIIAQNFNNIRNNCHYRLCDTRDLTQNSISPCFC